MRHDRKLDCKSIVLHTLFLAVVFFVIVGWFYFPGFAPWARKWWQLPPTKSDLATDQDWQANGQFGDTYGAFNALVTALAFTAAAYAVWLQYVALKEQRMQAIQQRVIDHFYQLLTAWQSVARETEYRDKQGVHAFCRMENDLLGEVILGEDGKLHRPNNGDYIGKERVRNAVGFVEPLERAKLRSIFDRFYEDKIGAPMGHIFRMQRELLTYVESAIANNAITRKSGDELIQIYRAQLSDPELHLLLYYSLSRFASTDYFDLISRHRLLEGLLEKREEFVRGRIPEISWYEDRVREFDATRSR